MNWSKIKIFFFHTDMLVDTAMDLKLGLIKAVMGNFVSSALFHFNLGVWDPIKLVASKFFKLLIRVLNFLF